MALEVHPVADLFPMLAEDELKELAEDIAQRGLLQPIVLDAAGRVLDGRNRLAACELASVEPRFETYAGDDPDGFALAVNGQRREMNKGQKALVGASMLISGFGSKLEDQEVARALGVSKAVLSKAITIAGYKDLAGLVLTGSMSFGAALEQAQERARAAAEIEAKKDRLAKAAPDLAEQVDDERLDLDEALGALEVREQRARQEAELARQQAAQDAERRRLEAGDQATVAEIDAVRTAEGGPAPTFAQRAESGALSWRHAVVEAERWLRDRDEGLERNRGRIRSIVSGWGAVRTILADPQGAYVLALLDGLGDSDRKEILAICNDLKGSDL